jgi:hypothetical protein
MTIAAGILCRDGIVMCADSQETYGDFKWPVKKIAYPRASSGDFSILISGAGFPSAIDTATQKIFERTAHSMSDYKQTVEIIESVLREIHEKDLAHYQANDRDNLQFRLLIAFNAAGNGGLFVSDGPILTRVDSFQIIGSGAVITNFFASMLYKKTLFESPDISIVEGSLLAAFLVHLAKSQLTSIGGESQLAMVTTEGIKFANVWEAPAWEPIFSKCLAIGSQMVLDCANPYLSKKNFEENLQDYCAAMKQMKRAIVKKRASWDKLWEALNQGGGRLMGHTPKQSDSSEPEK